MATAKIGRPRSEKSREAIIGAAQALLNEKGGAGLTIEAIARRAGVGKPTIYRWWPTLADLVLEALLRQADETIAVPPRGSLRETLRPFLRQSMKAIADGGGAHLRFLMARAQMDEGFRQRFRDTFAARRRAVLKSVLLRAAERGEIGPGQNLDMLLDLVFGAMWYRLLIGHAAIDEPFADALTETIVGLVQPGEFRGQYI
ncbi:MAG: TetR/AcrR family transcriptional regulator [Rhodospirillales bacterium]|nr:TetR/AcrR family transcriptional regulator [Rhodospirillales bacterium]